MTQEEQIAVGRDVVETVAKALVDDPDTVVVSEEISRHGQVTYLIDARPEDRGKVIGKRGRTIEALRKLLWAVGGRFDVDFDVELLME